MFLTRKIWYLKRVVLKKRLPGSFPDKCKTEDRCNRCDYSKSRGFCRCCHSQRRFLNLVSTDGTGAVRCRITADLIIADLLAEIQSHHFRDFLCAPVRFHAYSAGADQHPTDLRVVHGPDFEALLFALTQVRSCGSLKEFPGIHTLVAQKPAGGRQRDYVEKLR